MKRVYFFIACLLAVFIAESAYSQGLPYNWARVESNTFNVNPSFARQAIAGYKGKVLWSVLQGIKLNYGQRSLGNYRLTEYDSAGTAGINTQITGKIAVIDVRPDAQGNWYLLGYYHDSMAFANGTILTRDPALLTTCPYFMCRLDAGTLALRWVKALGSNIYCRTDCFTLKNNIIYLPVDSSLGSTINKMDITNGDRTLLWQQGNSYVNSLEVDDAGNMYIAGGCADINMTFNGASGAIPPGIAYREYVVRYKAGGQHDWHFWMNEQTCMHRKLSVVNNNFIYYSGALFDSVEVNGHRFKRGLSLLSDYLMVRMDSTGDVKWGRQLTGITTQQGTISLSDPFHGAVKDSSFLLFAATRGTINWGNNVTTTTLNFAANATIVSVAADGTTTWAKTVKARYSSAQHLVCDGQAVWITGLAMDSNAVSFDSLSVPVTPAYAPYLARMQAKTIPLPSTGINSVAAGANFIVYPNPATDRLIVDGFSAGATITLRDMTGRSILSEQTSSGLVKKDISRLPRGIYFLELQQTGARNVRKVIFQ